MIRQKNRFLFPALIVVLILIAAAIFFAQNKGEFTDIPLPGIPVEPTSSLDFMRKRTDGCTTAVRDQFVKDASRINGVFEDNFALASGTSRIALSPIVANMQSAARETMYTIVSTWDA